MQIPTLADRRWVNEVERMGQSQALGVRMCALKPYGCALHLAKEETRKATVAMGPWPHQAPE